MVVTDQRQRNSGLSSKSHGRSKTSERQSTKPKVGTAQVNATSQKIDKAPSTVTAEAELQQLQFLLAQIWHRNKNQHRTQKWWKWVGILRRGIRDMVLLSLSPEQDGRPDGINIGEAEKTRNRMERERRKRQDRDKVEEWLREVVLGKAWLAFSTLVADTQFSALGVVLLAALARVGKLVGLPAPDAPRPEEKRKTVLATSLTQTGDDKGEVVQSLYVNEDVGEVVTRETRTQQVVPGKREDDVQATVEHSKEKRNPTNHRSGKDGASITKHEPHTTAERPKKRRKKANAIDELFAGL